MKLVRLLLVDDEVVFTKNMKTLLENRGYVVTAVNCGSDALLELESREIDVVVLDLEMPGMDGMTTLRRIKEAGYMTEVLILTGHGAIDTALEAVKLGAYDYLAKPCEVEDMVEKLEGAFDRNQRDRLRERESVVRRVVESPAAALDLMSGKRGRKPPAHGE